MKARIVFLFLLSFAMSCSEIALLPEPDLDVLSFQSFEQFENITSSIASMPQSELTEWESTNSFKSYRSVLAEAHAEWADVDDEVKAKVF